MPQEHAASASFHGCYGQMYDHVITTLQTGCVPLQIANYVAPRGTPQCMYGVTLQHRQQMSAHKPGGTRKQNMFSVLFVHFQIMAA